MIAINFQDLKPGQKFKWFNDTRNIGKYATYVKVWSDIKNKLVPGYISEFSSWCAFPYAHCEATVYIEYPKLHELKTGTKFLLHGKKYILGQLCNNELNFYCWSVEDNRTYTLNKGITVGDFYEDKI